jgi:lipid A 3-O-deacylase
MHIKIHIPLIAFLVAGLLLVFKGPAVADDEGKYDATRYGVSLVSGRSYDPTNNIDFYMVSGFALFDYDRIWRHKAPDTLRFRVEGSIGSAHYNKTRFVSSVNMFATCYLDPFKTHVFKPYVEGGIGIIYTDFQVRGQGLRFNFNPQLGVGTEIKAGNDRTYYLSLRLHHISNGGLDDENRGVNSVMGMFGFYF